MNNAQILAQAQRLADQMQSALRSLAVIERAVGVLMSRGDCAHLEALEELRAISQREHRTVAAVAEQIWDDAVLRSSGQQNGR